MFNRKFIIGAVVLILMMTALVATVVVQAQGQETCPDGGEWTKDESVSGHTYTITVPEGKTLVQICYKAGTGVSYIGPLNEVGPTTYTFTISSQQELSHVSYRLVDTPTATPTLTPTNTRVPPTDTPTDVPPTEVPPTDVPPTDVPPTNVPPTEAPASNVCTDLVLYNFTPDGSDDIQVGVLQTGIPNAIPHISMTAEEGEDNINQDLSSTYGGVYLRGNEAEGYRLYVANVVGTPSEVELTWPEGSEVFNGPIYASNPKWHPYYNWILADVDIEGSTTIYLFMLSGRTVVDYRPIIQGSDAAWQTSGQMVAFTRPDGTLGIFHFWDWWNGISDIMVYEGNLQVREYQWILNYANPYVPELALATVHSEAEDSEIYHLYLDGNDPVQVTDNSVFDGNIDVLTNPPFLRRDEGYWSWQQGLGNDSEIMNYMPKYDLLEQMTHNEVPDTNPTYLCNQILSTGPEISIDNDNFVVHSYPVHQPDPDNTSDLRGNRITELDRDSHYPTNYHGGNNGESQ